MIAGGHFNQMGAFKRKHLGGINKVTAGSMRPGTRRPTAPWECSRRSLSGNMLFVGGDFTAWEPGNVAQAHFAQFS